MKYHDLFGKQTPTVEQVAKKHNVSISRIEQQLAKGIKFENEHTNDLRIAREIALDHLSEISDYYDRLERMEKRAEGSRD